MKEIWKDIKGYEGLYQVSNLGNVKSINRYVKYNRWKESNSLQLRKEKMLAKTKTNNGYLRIMLSKNGSHKMVLLHRLVANAFISNQNNYSQVNHIDCNKENNCVSNLEWCSCKMNMEHAWENKIYKGRKIAQYKNGELIAIYDKIMDAVRNLGIKNNGQSIGKVALGKRKSAYGFQWKYI